MTRTELRRHRALQKEAEILRANLEEAVIGFNQANDERGLAMEHLHDSNTHRAILLDRMEDLGRLANKEYSRRRQLEEELGRLQQTVAISAEGMMIEHDELETRAARLQMRLEGLGVKRPASGGRE